MSDTTVTGLSPELVAAKAELAAIERKRDQGRYGNDVFAIQADLSSVIASALVSIATSLETSALTDRVADLGGVVKDIAISQGAI